MNKREVHEATQGSTTRDAHGSSIRDARINLRLTQGEKQKLKDAAASMAMTITEYILFKSL